MNKPLIYLCLLLFKINFTCHLSYAQKNSILSGVIVNDSSNEPVPFATIFLKNRTIGTMANDSGKFDLLLPLDYSKDTLLVTSVGYIHYSTIAPGPATFIYIRLKPSREELKEVPVSPLPPTYYINNAMKAIGLVRPVEAYVTYGYYVEQILEDNKILRYDEAVFKSFIPKFKEKLRRQYQLLLYRHAKNINDMQFMRKERLSMEQKENKKKKTNSEPRTGIDYVFLSGGPPVMLKYATISTRADNYLDSTKFKYFNYYFEPSNSNEATDLLVINFASKVVTDHMSRKGKIYIHLPTNTILKIEGQGNFVVPALLRPLMFLYGFNVQQMTFNGRKEYQLFNGKWYFKTTTVHAHVKVTKRHLFSSNEHAEFEGKQTYTLLKIQTENLAQIDSLKRYDHEKTMGRQVNNDEGLTWDKVEKLIAK